MFPVIFTLTLERSSASTDATSGFLCMSIIGGAIIPLIVGKIADMSGYSAGLAVPMLCYVILCVIAIAAGRAPTHAAGVASDEEIVSPHLSWAPSLLTRSPTAPHQPGERAGR